MDKEDPLTQCMYHGCTQKWKQEHGVLCVRLKCCNSSRRMTKISGESWATERKQERILTHRSQGKHSSWYFGYGLVAYRILTQCLNIPRMFIFLFYFVFYSPIILTLRSLIPVSLNNCVGYHYFLAQFSSSVWYSSWQVYRSHASTILFI